MERTSTTGRWVSVTATVIAVAVCLIGPAVTPAFAQSNVLVVDTTGVESVDKTLAKNLIASDPAASQVALSGDGRVTFVAHANSSLVSKLDAAGNLLTTIDVGGTPAALAASQTGDVLYVLRPVGGPSGAFNASGEVVAFNLVGGPPSNPVAVGESFGGIAVSGDHVFVAAGDLTVLNADGTVAGALPLNGDPNLFNFAVSILVNGNTAYLAINTYNYAGFNGFSATGSVLVVNVGNPTTPAAEQSIPLFSIPEGLALANGHLFVGIPYIWADSLYGAGFLPSDWVANVDPASGAISWINLGTAGNVPGAVYSAGSLAAAPDGSAVFVAIPSGNSIALIDVATGGLATNTDGSVATIAVGSPTNLAAVTAAAVAPTDLKLVAGDDSAAAPVPAGGVRAAISNVLANDTLGGVPASLSSVEFVDGPSAGVTLDRTTGAVWVADGVDPGAQSFTYVIREKGKPTNTATGHISLTVRNRYAIVASGDTFASTPGAAAFANVLANDSLNGSAGTNVGDVAITITALDARGGVSVDEASGAVSVSADAAFGSHVVSYNICERAAHNCSGDAQVTVSVVNRHITAVTDQVVAPRTGAASILNVLANDTIEGAGGLALAGAVSDGAGVSIDASGLVSVARDAAAGLHALAYSVCEVGRADNCATGTLNATVNKYVITAGADSARLSPKNPATAIANVLANDMLGDMAATTANVRLTRYTVSPATDTIVLNTSTGAVNILKNAVSGIFTLTYQVCEAADLTNCALGKATITLSNGGGGGGGRGQ